MDRYHGSKILILSPIIVTFMSVFNPSGYPFWKRHRTVESVFTVNLRVTQLNRSIGKHCPILPVGLIKVVDTTY